MADLLALESALIDEVPVKKGCPVARAIRGFEGNLRESVSNAVWDIDLETGNHVWSAPNLVKLLNDKADLSLTASTMQRHRGGKCSCPHQKG